MKRMNRKCVVRKIWMSAVTLLLVLFIGLTAEQFSVVSHAQSEGKVIVDSANIRKEPSASSDAVGSAKHGDVLTISSQVNGSDGKVWYQVFVNANTQGYIRNDLIEVTGGDGDASVPTETYGVTPVEPVSASVSGSQMVRVRSEASTSSNILTTVENGSALTVTGQANGSDGKVWYQVQFVDDGAQVTGFIRSDYVTISGDVTPVVPQDPVDPGVAEPQEPIEEEPQEPQFAKDWETQLQGEDWYLLDVPGNSQYKIEDLFAAVEQNKLAYQDSAKTVKSQKILIIILVLLVLALGGGAAFLVYKMKEMMDSAYFNEVERDTIRRRNESGGKANQKVMHTVGAEKKAVEGGRPANPQGRPAGQPQGGRPVNPQGRPAGAQPQGGRPVNPQGRSAGQPQGGRPVNPQERPAGQPQGGRPVNPQERPVGQPQGTRPVNPQGRPAGAQPQGGRPVNPQGKPAGAQPQAGKPKNFMAEDDEFEFEFLNWDGEEET